MSSQQEKRYDIWLLNSITELLHKVESGIEEEEAIEWLKAWNQDHRDCVCILALQQIEIPTTIRLANDG